MLTRCPHCETHFRVTPEQIKARGGRVRCGACQQVFNALDTLSETIVSPMAAAPAEPEPEIAAQFSEAIEPELAPSPEEPPPEELPPTAAAPDPVAPEPEAPVPADTGVVDAPPPEVAPPAWLEPALSEEQPRLVWPWALGCVTALCVLCIQAVIHFRTEIAVLHPEAKPLLLTLCDGLGCELSLPRKAELIGIESSDLHPDPAGAGRLQMVALLKNRAPFAQEFPHLELTLTDGADQVLTRRVLAPMDYLPAGAPAQTAGFPASADLPVNLLIEASGAPAAGYRLYLFYP